MTWRDALLFFHIVGAGTWLGANVVQMVAPSMAFAQGDQAAAGWMRIGGNLGKRLYMPAGIVVLLTGILLVIQSPVFGFADRFVTVGFAMIIFGNVLGPVVFTPGAEKTAQALEAGDRDMATALLGRIGRFGALDTILLLFTFWVMIIRWN
jgi:hypothetical protein